MNKLIISGLLGVLLLTGGTSVAFAQETAPKSQAAMLAQIEQLMKLIAELQKQLNVAKGEVQELKADLSEGAEGDDVLKVQELLATDPTILSVKPTGFFGPRTKEALMKFQERYGLEVTGRLDEPTREVMKELRKEKVAPGLIKSEEVKSRVKARLQEKWKDCDFTLKFRASACEKIKDKKDHDDEDEIEDDSDEVTVSRDEARRAVVDAQNEVNKFRDSIEDMEDEDASKDELEEARDLLRDAQKKLNEARRALAKGEFNDALESSEEVVYILTGDDSSEEEEDEE